jgi:hypothetical protein
MNTQLDRTIKTIANHTQSFANIIQKELANTGFEKNLPIDLVLDMINTIIKHEMGSVLFSLSEPALVMKPTLTAKTSVGLPASNKGKQITLQLKQFLRRDY